MENQYFLRKKTKHTQDINNQISDNSNIIINKELKYLLKNFTLENDESYEFWENYFVQNINNQNIKINKSDLTKFETFLSKDYTNETINYLYLKFLLLNFNTIKIIKSIDLIQLIFNKLEVSLSDDKLNELEDIKNDKKIILYKNNYFSSNPNYIIKLLKSILNKENLEKNAEFKIKFNSYGIPIGFSNNQNIILRYYYYSIYCKIKEYQVNFRVFIGDILNILQNKKVINIIDIECISVFLFYSNEIYANNIGIEFSYYYEYFKNLIKEDKKIEPNFNYLNSSENELIFFDNKNDIKNKISKNLNIKNKEPEIRNIEKSITNNFIYFNNNNNYILIVNLLNDIKNYNIYNILLNKATSFKNIENCKGLYYSYKNSTFNDYLYEFKNLLKYFVQSNLFKNLILFEKTFKKNLNIYNNELFNDIIENRLVFLPVSIQKYYGVTDKNILKIYLNNLQNTFSLNDNDYSYYFYNIFNIGNNSASFIHENFHFLFVYNFYFNNLKKQNINYDFENFEDKGYFTDDELLSFEFDTLFVCKNTEKYLNKFKSILSKEELNELDEIEECSKIDPDKKQNRKVIINNSYFKFINNFLTFIKNNNNKIKGDCGRKFDIILFSDERGQIKNNVNLLQIIMLIDEQSYNLHPFSFKYIFNELGKENKSLKFIKQNFKGNLINKIYENGLKNYLIDENIINKNLNLSCSIFKSQKEILNKRKNNIIKFVKEDGKEYDMINLEMNDFKCDLFKDTMY